MKEVIVRLTSDHIKVKGGEYVRDYERGEWIKCKQECEYKCSECGKVVFADDVNELNFCCSCGADMREVRDE